MKRFVLTVAGLFMVGSLVVVYGCPQNNETGGMKEEAGHTQEQTAMPEGHPPMESLQQGQMEMPESKPLNPKGEPMVGVWKNPNTGGSIRVVIENDVLVYKGAWGDAPLVKIDENNAQGDMSGMPIKLSLNGNTLSVELVGFNETYTYERAG